MAADKAQELAAQTGSTKVIKGKGVLQAELAMLTYGASAAYLAAKKVKQVRSNKRAQDGLRGVLPLVRCIASPHEASGADPGELPALQLIETKKDQYELIEVTI